MTAEADTAGIDESEIQWEDFTSKSGNRYQVGFLPTGQLLKNDRISSSQGSVSKKNFGVAVDWPVGDGTWINTTSYVQSVAAITKYTLHTNSGEWAYRLEFQNTEHYDYYFYDQTGDSYEVNTYRNGSHYVRYNSASPTIAYISGS